MNQNFIRATSAAACAVLLAACNAGNPLDVQNLNNPDVKRSYGSPASLDGIVGSTYQQFNNVWNNTSGADVDSKMFSTEGFSTVANFCMNNYAAVPRNPIINQVGGQCDGQQLNDFQGFQELARNTANMIKALDKLTAAGLTTGTAATDARDRGFLFFVNAISLGELAVMYDSAAITIPSTVPLVTTVPPLAGYPGVMTAALAQLDSAIAIFSAGVASPPSPTMMPVLPAATGFTGATWLQFLHSWKARLRAGVARTPTERAAVDWASVIADATAGITADVQIAVGGGWSCGYNCSQMYSSNGWHEMTLMTLGMADTSGAYATFNSLPILQRDGSQLVISTPDKRLPPGTTRGAQDTVTLPLPAGRYIANRLPSGDFSGPGFGTSQYDYKRNYAVFKAKAVGPVVQFALAENTMLQAEGDIYTGNLAGARTLIDASRALHGLASIGPATLVVPIAGVLGGNGGVGVPPCVPSVPAPPSFNTLQCGNILEAMKWEKRMETAYTAYATWYQDSRGWGDLVAGTALMWPVPNEEMSSRVKPFYSIGGLGQPNSATLGTYGW